MCRAKGIVAVATVADHVVPHKGNYDLFWHGELQSLCAFHHNKTKQRIERKGSNTIDVEYSNACDVHGKPIDPRHPSNKSNEGTGGAKNVWFVSVSRPVRGNRQN